MEMKEFVGLVSNVGFPVLISSYLLIRLERRILDLTSSISKLNTIISAKLGVVIENDNINRAL